MTRHYALFLVVCLMRQPAARTPLEYQNQLGAVLGGRDARIVWQKGGWHNVDWAQAYDPNNDTQVWGVDTRDGVERAITTTADFPPGSGMLDHVDFDEQAAGDSGRPDMIVRLPQGGVLPIDSKVSLGAFLEAMEADEEEIRKKGLIAHSKAVRARVTELSKKAYWEQFKEETPEVVVMFVPVEASLGAAFQHDPSLFEYAFDNRVLVVSPVLLFALLKTVAHGWQQHRIAENAAHIAEHGKNLYDRVLRFLDLFSGVGKCIESSVKKYNEAVGSLDGRLLPAARRFRDMIAASKDIESPERIESRTRALSLPEEELREAERQRED